MTEEYHPTGTETMISELRPRLPLDAQVAHLQQAFETFGPLLSTLGQIGETLAASFGLGAGPVGAAAGLLVLLGKLAQTQHGVSMSHIEPGPQPSQSPEDGSVG